jgi:hypothetical protein
MNDDSEVDRLDLEYTTLHERSFSFPFLRDFCKVELDIVDNALIILAMSYLATEEAASSLGS